MNAPARIVRGSADAAIVAIRKESAAIGWPMRFATDLDHDERAIRAMGTREPFAWILRTDGTHIASAPDARGGARLTIAMIVDTFGRDQCRIYLWNGDCLCEYASAALAYDVLTNLHHGWRHPDAFGGLESTYRDG